jgi:membrane-associated phospholipid phosphatase
MLWRVRPWSFLRATVLAGSAIGIATSGAFAQSLQDLRPGSQITEHLGLTIPNHPSTSEPPAEGQAAFALRKLMQPLEGDASTLPARYKQDAPWWSRNFRGVDFLEPLLPRAAASEGDIGNIVLDSALPYALLTTAFAARSTDQATLTAIGRWGWVGIDERQENYPLEIGLVALGAAGILLPSTLEGGTHYGSVLVDRAVVFVLGFGTAYGTTEILKHAIARRRPNGEDSLSRPSGHATAGFASMAFLSNVLRDTLEPRKESNLGFRILKEVATALPYLGAGYLALERVHGKDHFLTDTLLGGAIGAFSVNMFYAWSFTRSQYGRDWLEHVSIGYDPTLRGIQILVQGRF